jgi:hypothetical protein
MESEWWIDDDMEQGVVRISGYHPRILRLGPSKTKKMSIRKVRLYFDIRKRKCPNEVLNEELYFAIYDSVYFGRSLPMVRRTVLSPFSGSKTKPSKKLSRSKQQVVNSTKTSVNFYQTIWRHTLWDSTLLGNSHGNLRSKNAVNNWIMMSVVERWKDITPK